jgi:hypothetical protein
MISFKTQTSLALFYLLIAAVFGVFLRSLHVFDIDVNYRFIVHAHSHIALLGWVYLCLTIVFYKYFIIKNKTSKSKYWRIFLFTQITLVGMMVTFPFQGYAFLSILFSTLFLFASYFFTWFFFKNVSLEIKRLTCYPYIKASLYYLVLSSIGPWALGVIMTTLGATSIWYRLAIYFYLHFQYNGWMVLAIIGLLVFIFEKRGITLSRKHNKNLFIAINLSVVLTLFLSVLWTKPPNLFFGLSELGAMLQVICFGYGIRLIKNKWKDIVFIFSKTEILLFKSVLFVLGIKLLLQLLGSLPYFANISATIIELTIAYLHWIFLGVISLSLFLILSITGLLKISKKHLLFYLLGFFLTEGLLIYKGIAIWSGKYTIIEHFSEYLFVASIILFLGIVFIFLMNIITTSTKHNIT